MGLSLLVIVSLRITPESRARRFDSLRNLKHGRMSRSQLVGEPVFKKKGRRDSFRYPQGTWLEQNNSRVFFPNLDGCAIETASKCSAW